MSRRLLLSYLSITVFVLFVLEVPFGAAYARAERRSLRSDVQHDALALSIRAEEAMESTQPANDRDAALAQLADRYELQTGGRVVIVAANGALLADSEPTVEGPRNFASRPEVRAALRGRERTGTRYSTTLGEQLLYFAVPIVHEGSVVGAVRVTYPTSFVDARIRRAWLVLGAIALVVLLVVLLVSLRLARQVSRPLGELELAAEQLGHGDLTVRATVPSGPAEVRELARSFNRTAARLEELVGGQRAFVADASHQLRTPLAALRLRLEYLEGELQPGRDAAEDLEAALAEVARLSRLVDGLLALARAEGANAAPEPQELAPLVNERAGAWAALASERGVQMEVETSPGTSVAATRGHVEQVLDNVLANALEASPPGSLVRVVQETRGNSVILHVIDEGPGMGDAERAHAFDRFWRARDGQPSAGSGLGLSIVRSLVVADEGHVALEIAPGGGLDVVLRWRRV